MPDRDILLPPVDECLLLLDLQIDGLFKQRPVLYLGGVVDDRVGFSLLDLEAARQAHALNRASSASAARRRLNASAGKRASTYLRSSSSVISSISSFSGRQCGGIFASICAGQRLRSSSRPAAQSLPSAGRNSMNNGS